MKRPMQKLYIYRYPNIKVSDTDEGHRLSQM
uniref:Uncharacterized protein n=1 Tax=Arundo donax TaxID=35708 RepID=A0A0A9ABJ5_ARUDO